MRDVLHPTPDIVVSHENEEFEVFMITSERGAQINGNNDIWLMIHFSILRNHHTSYAVIVL